MSVDEKLDQQLDEILNALSYAQWELGNKGLIPLSKNINKAKQAIKDLIATEVLHARIEEYLNNIVGELSKLNKHLAKGYRVRCDKCGDELYVSKKMVAEDIGDYPSNWYFEWRKTHKELANPAFDCECSGIVELFEEEVWGE